MIKEIGSEFWFENINVEYLKKENNNFFNFGKDVRFLMSGRTAIDYVLKNIKLNYSKKLKAYLPSYCCESMVDPFLKNEIEIEFYEVIYDQKEKKFIYKINLEKDIDIFLALEYFGFSVTNMDDYISVFKEKNKIVIEDITHRMLSEKNYCQKSDYLIASLRKWFPIYTGGIAISLHNHFLINTENFKINTELVNLKKAAMKEKKDYIFKIRNVSKDLFLEKYKKSNKMFYNYSNFKIDDESMEIIKKIDIDFIKSRRKKNARVIYKALSQNNFKDFKLMFKQFSDGDVPLFIPIIVKNRKEKLDTLIKHNIYCPIHWPKIDAVNSLSKDIYENELSLICDHRYEFDESDNWFTILMGGD